MGDDASRRRQRLSATAEAYQLLIEALLVERGPLIRGSFGVRARVCGKAGCRCTRGELHESKYLSATVDGQVRLVHVPSSDEFRVAECVARYRRFQQARKKLAEIAKRQLELVDALGHVLLASYPPDDPIPPARKRGRKPAEPKDG